MPVQPPWSLGLWGIVVLQTCVRTRGSRQGGDLKICRVRVQGHRGLLVVLSGEPSVA